MGSISHNMIWMGISTCTANEHRITCVNSIAIVGGVCQPPVCECLLHVQSWPCGRFSTHTYTYAHAFIQRCGAKYAMIGQTVRATSKQTILNEHQRVVRVHTIVSLLHNRAYIYAHHTPIPTVDMPRQPRCTRDVAIRPQHTHKYAHGICPGSNHSKNMLCDTQRICVQCVCVCLCVYTYSLVRRNKKRKRLQAHEYIQANDECMWTRATVNKKIKWNKQSVVFRWAQHDR